MDIYTKDYCREYILIKKKYLNMAAICKELGIQPPHVTYFLKGKQYDMFMSIENANRIVHFISNLSDY